MKFGENLKLLRNKNKMSQDELADKVMVSRQSISKWETGAAYPEMNNILQLCKIFNCKLNDLVHEDISDIDLLDDEVKEKVKFQIEKQKKMKAITKIVYIVAKYFSIITSIALVVSIICGILLPFTFNSIVFSENSIMLFDYKIGTIGLEEYNVINELLTKYSTGEIILWIELILISLFIILFLFMLVFKNLYKLFKNIHNEKTPFTNDNVIYIKKISKLLIIEFLFNIFSSFTLQSVIGANFGIEIDPMDGILLLVIVCISYIFEYGYAIQIDSEGVMYGKE